MNIMYDKISFFSETAYTHTHTHTPGEGNGNPLQYSCLGNPMDRRIQQTVVHGVRRVGCDSATKQEQHQIPYSFLLPFRM